MSYKVAMLGAGSFFTDTVTEGLCHAKELFAGCDFVLMDTDRTRLQLAVDRNREIVKRMGGAIRISGATNRRQALEGCRYAVTACERNRVPYWIKDIEIPMRHGVVQYKGENGGPGGQAHAMRNITMFMGICADMRRVCPDAWLMNFTNPMSFLCTYFKGYGGVKALGFCHQVHGSMGVVAEMLGYEPGDLEVISGGVNHFNWPIDIRRRQTGESCLKEFKARVMRNKYWRRVFHNIPPQVFTREILRAFGEYPIGYDNHICEYTPFFFAPADWPKMGYEVPLETMRRQVRSKARWRRGAGIEALKSAEVRARAEYHNVPFPRDGNHPYYREKPTQVMEAFETNRPLYLTSMVIRNDGAIGNLPADAVVDVPAVAAGGSVRGVRVGDLPTFAMELCRRQITIHELLTEAVVHGDRGKVVQSLALDPYVRGIRQAERIADDFLRCYRWELPQFSRRAPGFHLQGQ